MGVVPPQPTLLYQIIPLPLHIFLYVGPSITSVVPQRSRNVPPTLKVIKQSLYIHYAHIHKLDNVLLGRSVFVFSAILVNFSFGFIIITQFEMPDFIFRQAYFEGKILRHYKKKRCSINKICYKCKYVYFTR